MKQELYVSTDVEADGPIPGPHSMLSFASVVYTKDKELISTFEAKLKLLDDAALDIKTLAMIGFQKPYCDSTKRNMSKRWFDSLPHTHKALDDAIEQGAMFCHILAGKKR